MLDSNQYENLPEFLEECVQNIKKKHPRLNTLQLAKKLDIAKSTFDRIIKKDVKLPTFNNALKIVRAACGEKNLSTFIQKHYPCMVEEFKTIYPNNTEAKFIDTKTEKYFEDASTFELMLMISSGKGVTRANVKDELGKKGIKALELLTKNEIVEEKNGRVQIKGKINAGQETVLELFKNLIASNYHLENFGEEGNWLSVQYEAVNRELAWPVIKSAIVEANKKIKEVFANPAYHGKDILWVGMASDALSGESKITTSAKQGELQ